MWLLDFDGVINALSARGGRSYWDDWASATIDHPRGEVTRAGTPVQVPLLWSNTVIAAVASAVQAGVDVRWLSTWREHTGLLSEVIPGLPALSYLDERVLGANVAAALDPSQRDYSGPWKARVAEAFVPEDAPLLWTDDARSVDLISQAWRGERRGPSVFIRPRPTSGLVQQQVRQIHDWIARYATPGG